MAVVTIKIEILLITSQLLMRTVSDELRPPRRLDEAGGMEVGGHLGKGAQKEIMLIMVLVVSHVLVWKAATEQTPEGSSVLTVRSLGRY